MKNDTIENINEKYININQNLQFCPTCNMLINTNIFQDHLYCHQIEEDNKIDNNKNEEAESPNTEDKIKNIPIKIFGFFENIGNKAKEIFSKEDNDNNTKKDEPGKVANFFSKVRDKINEKIDDIKTNLSNNNEEEERRNSYRNNRNHILQNILNIRNRNRNDRIDSDYRDSDNIDDLLIRFEDEDNNINLKKDNLFKEEDANEILRYIPCSIIQEEKLKNENNNKCVICLYEFKIGDKVSTLPCLHLFHNECLKNWILRSTWCPICKLDISLDSLFSKNNF
jgi:hypothetical protein